MAVIRNDDYDRFFGKLREKPKREYNSEAHTTMCKRAAQWLRGTKGCNVAVWELTAACSEKPDAIGWHPYKSTLVECKTSRSDFLRDCKKHHKKTPGYGMGNYRYYMCPIDVIKAEDLPENWGLLYLVNNKVRIIKEATEQESNLFVERTFLASILRRQLDGCAYLKTKISEADNDNGQ
jgi:hypothetical protein